MTGRASALFTGTLLAALALVWADVAAKVNVKVEAEKTFDFKTVQTWGWNPSGPGEVKMARTPDDDPEVFRKAIEPIIVDAVNTEIPQRGLKSAKAKPDLVLTYYVLLTVGAATQTAGQFLPGTTSWALPPFAPATVSMTMMNQGALVLDLAANGTVVWRGVAQARIAMDADDKKRESVIREAVRELLKKYPPKK